MEIMDEATVDGQKVERKAFSIDGKSNSPTHFSRCWFDI